MGQPKALLPLPNGTPLARHQADLLQTAGADPCIIVVGAHGPTLAAALASLRHRVVINHQWETGRLSSLQAGIREAPPDAAGAVILPVDTVGVLSSTFEKLLIVADTSPAKAIRPRHAGEPGRIVWISRDVLDEIAHLVSTPDFRLDAWLKPHETNIAVDDPALLHNINTPAQWQSIMRN